MQRTLGEAKVPLLEEMGSMYQEMDQDSGDQNNSDQGRLKGGGGGGPAHRMGRHPAVLFDSELKQNASGGTKITRRIYRIQQ